MRIHGCATGSEASLCLLPGSPSPELLFSPVVHHQWTFLFMLLSHPEIFLWVLAFSLCHQGSPPDELEGFGCLSLDNWTEHKSLTSSVLTRYLVRSFHCFLSWNWMASHGHGVLTETECACVCCICRHVLACFRRNNRILNSLLKSCSRRLGYEISSGKKKKKYLYFDDLSVNDSKPYGSHFPPIHTVLKSIRETAQGKTHL